jgi:cobalt-zinc-cadmium efflux system outer membrane protein
MRREAIIACLLVALAAGAGTAQEQAAPISLQQLEQLALERHPAIAQAAAAIEAARGRATQAGLLPNPIVGYSGEEIRPGGEVRGEHGFFVEQTIPLAGKLAIGREVFEREAARVEALAAVERQRLVNAVRRLFYESLGAERRVELRERLSQLAGEAVLVSRQLYNVGAADRPDVLESEIEAFQARVSLDSARNERFRAWRRLAAMTGLSEAAPRPLAGSFDAPLPELDRTAIAERLVGESPEIRAAEAAVTRSEFSIRRARRETAPDLFLRAGPSYNRERLERDSTGVRRPVGWEANVEVGVSVPLFNRNQGSIAASVAELSQSRAKLARLRLDLEARLAAAFEVYLTALRRAEVYRQEILPRAEEAYTLYLTRYREMAAAYPQVLIAQRTLVQVSEEYIAAVERTWRTAADLEGFLISDGPLRESSEVEVAMERKP